MSAVYDILIPGVLLLLLVCSLRSDQHWIRHKKSIEERDAILAELEKIEAEQEDAKQEEYIMLLDAAEQQIEALIAQRDAIITEANRQTAAGLSMVYVYPDVKRATMIARASRINAQICEIRLRTKKRISEYN